MEQERPVRPERRLAAIMAADVAGYSRLMHRDEEATHALMTTLFAEGIAPAIAEHGGRIVKNTGDGFLAEFPSAVEAVRAAVQFQARIREFSTTIAEDRRAVFRVGINVGDVIVEPHDVFGDGVNIAARLESIAEPGGICISYSAYDHVRGKAGIEFVDLGEQNLKNIDRPIRAYAAAWDKHGLIAPGERAKESLPSPPRLSIVVLPFANLSGDPAQDYFADGVTESLTTDLSRIKGSFVIGRHTAFTYKGKAVDLRQIGRELNVRYALEGSVQRGDNRLRVNVQLVDAESGNHLWADRFDKPIADLFEMQDEIVSRVARTLDTQLVAAEARRAENLPHPDATDLYFQGRSRANEAPSPEGLMTARDFFERALVLDPRDVRALAGLAGVDLTMGADHFIEDRTTLLSTAEANAIKAVSLSPDYAVARFVLGSVYICTNRADKGIAECEMALDLDRNFANAHAAISLAKYYMGRAAESENHIREAFRLSPRDAQSYRWMHFAGLAKLQLGADVEAVDWLRRSIEVNRNSANTYFVLGGALGLLGAVDDARAATIAGLAFVPDFTIRRLRTAKFSDNPTYLAGRERICEGMRIAGVPEG